MRFVYAAATGIVLLFPVAGAALAVSGIVAPSQIALHLAAMVTAGGAVGMVALVGIQIVIAASGLLPASLVGVTAGLLCGPIAGFAMAAICTLLGALVTFAAVRRLSTPHLERLFRRRPRLQTFDTLLAQDGWRFVALVRLSPVVPFAATSALLGASSVSAADYVVGTCASLPALLAYVLTGALLRRVGLSWSAGLDCVPVLLFGLGIVATVALTLRVGRLATRALVAERSHTGPSLSEEW